MLESVINPLNYPTLYSYTPSGLIKEITTPKDDKVTFEYDKVNRNTDIKLNGTEQYHYGYDVRGNVLSSEDKILNLTWSATYDDNDLLTSWKDSSLGSINYTLDESGNVTQRKLNNLSGSTLKSESITYNKANQPTSLTDGQGKVSKFLFNENKMISNIYSGIDAGNSIISSYSYDNNNRLSNVRNQTNTGKILSSFRYGVNSQTSRIESIKDQTGKTLNFTYTTKGQLKTEILPNGNNVTYGYDELGNRTSRVENKPDGTNVSSIAYSYANNKFQISSVNGKSWSYDESGNVTNDGKNKYTWDASNRITEVRDASTNAVKATYKYDDKGRRIEQTVNGQVTKFLYDGKSNKVLAEYDGAGALLKYYTWSPMGMLLSITVGEGPTAPTYYTVRNGHGDIVQLTDKDGNVVVTYTYDAWGNLTKPIDPAIAAINPYRYAGYRYDDSTGLYYLMNRYYDSSVGRFLSIDPVSEVPDYTYGANNPLSYVDPNGLWWADVLFFLADVVSFFSAPSWSVAGMIIADIFSFADPSGIVTGAIHGGRALTNAIKASKVAKYIGKLARPGKKIPSGYTGRFKMDLQYFASNKKIVNNPVLDNSRTGSALKIDSQHAFNDIIDNYAGQATRFDLKGGDGVTRGLYQIEGSLNGKQGVFEWIVDPNKGVGVTHRRFIEGVGVTGFPNARR